MSASLVGSEMCIRDRAAEQPGARQLGREPSPPIAGERRPPPPLRTLEHCLLYTSDAADDM
eukprot:2426134-Alexandrium_andersonii.AAC.1